MFGASRRGGRVTALAAVITVALTISACGSSAGGLADGNSAKIRSGTANSLATGTPSPSRSDQVFRAAATATASSVPSSSPTSTIPPSLIGKDVEVIPTKTKIVALTFDAGANADGLPSILSTLSGQKVPATFFLTGSWAAAHPSAVKQLVAGGYRLGNHTATHPYLTKLSDAAIRSQLTKGRSQILAAGGTEPVPLFRFPFGDRKAHTISVVNKAGYVAVRWTVDTLGWKGTSGGMSTRKVVDRAVAAAKPGEIVLMHVGSNPDDKTTLDAAALPTIITKLKALGYGFVTLDSLLGSGGGVILPGCDATAWRTAPISVTHDPSVPPVPVVTGIRTGSHPECRYDRLVLDLSGAMPGYQIRSVDKVIGDPSGNPVSVPGGGTSFLLITLHPAQAHTDIGTISPTSAATGYPALKGYALTGDVEGTVSIALGLARASQIRAGELSGRLFVDVAY